MNQALTSVFAVLVLFSLQCASWPYAGQQAKDDNDCFEQYGKETCSEIGDYTCAKIDDHFINYTTMCDFCKTYGNSQAIVYYTGNPRHSITDEEITCKELEVGDFLTNDPECTWIADNYFPWESSPLQHCSAVQNLTRYYCVSELDPPFDDFIAMRAADTKCEICAEYGGEEIYNYKIESIGVNVCNKPTVPKPTVP